MALFQLTDEQQAVRDMARNFARKELAPQAAELDETGRFPEEIYRQMGPLGLLGVNIPAEYDGAEMGPVAYSLAVMELAQGCAATTVAMAVTNMVAEAIKQFGSDAQKKKYLPYIMSGECITGSFALSEGGSGSDALAMKTKAVLDGDKWIINGSKRFITSGAFSGVTIVMARTSDATGTRGVTAFLVDRGKEGMIVGPEEKKMGLKGSNTVELIFEDCAVPAESILGNEGEGFKIAMMALDGGRIGVASQALGIGRAAMTEAVNYSKERKQFGRSLAEFQATQWKIADMATRLDASELLILRAADMKERGIPFTKEASMAKLFTTETANWVCGEAVQIHGGYGYIKEYPVERLYRDVRVTTIYEGTSEVQRMVISRKVLQG
jgi:acyl-CoA dehydrogenase